MLLEGCEELDDARVDGLARETLVQPVQLDGIIIVRHDLDWVRCRGRGNRSLHRNVLQHFVSIPRQQVVVHKPLQVISVPGAAA